MADKTIKTSIQIDADIKSFEQGLSSIEAKLAQLKVPAGLARSFSSEISSIKEQLTKLGDYTANNELSIIDAKKAEKSLEIIQQQYARLIKSLKDEKMGDIVSKEDATRMAALSRAIEAYETKMAGAVKTEERLTRELERAKAAQEELNKRKEQQRVIDEADYAILKNQVTEQRKKEKELLKTINEAAAKKEERKASSGGKYTDDNSKGFKQTAEYQAWKKAVDELNLAKQRTIQLQQQLDGVTTSSQIANEEKKVAQGVADAESALKSYQSTALETAKTEAFSAAKEELKDVQGITPDTINNFEELKETLLSTQNAAQENAASIKDMSSDLETCGQAADNLDEKIDGATDSLDKQNEAAKKTDGFITRIKQFTGLTGAMMIFRKVATSAFNAIKELDAQMTEMAVVTNQSVGDYWKQMPEHTKRANELGMAIKDVYEAETLYYQQGLKANEVTEMSNSTLRMARIAGLSAAEATDKMTAALRGFNMELNGTSADRVADVYSKLAAITASNVDEISTAMTKTASIASSAGMEFETTAAFLSQIIETTRESAETAGTALKTVIARFQELKKDPSEIGEVDGEIVDANKIETALRSVGVNLRDVSGQFRDLDTVFMELAQKWDTLDTNTQRYIATIAAGSRQQSRFIAMMSDYSRTSELVTAANDAAGASNEQFEKTQESLETALNRLKNAWTEFTTGLMNNEFIKFIVDALTGILNALNTITSSSNSAVNSMLKIGLIIGIVFAAKAAIDAFSVGVKNAGEETGVVSAGMSGVFDAVKGKIDQVGLKLKYVFDKDYRLKIQDKQTDEVRAKLKRLSEIEKELANNEKTVADTHKKLASNQKVSNAEVQKANALESTNNKLKQEQAALNKELNALGAVTEKVKFAENLATEKGITDEMAKTAAEAAGIPIDNARILLAKGYTQEQIKEMGAKKANMIATVTKNGLTVTETTTTLGLWIATKLSTAAQSLATKGKLGSIIATKLQTIANWALQASMGAILLVIIAIIAAIALLVIGIMAIIKAVKKNKENSPEERLKKDKKALEDATEAANAAADSYKNLSDSVDKLKDGYKNLDTLTRGTKEWEKAVDEVNDQVMDLIEKYPELADQVETVNGVMKLSDEALDSITKKEKSRASTLKVDQINAAKKVAKTKTEVDEKAAKKAVYNNLNKNSIGKPGAIAGAVIGMLNPATAISTALAVGGTAISNKVKANNSDKEMKAVAEALASGKLKKDASADDIKAFMEKQGMSISDAMAKSFESSRESLRKWGESLNDLTNAQKAAAKQMTKIALDNSSLDADQKANINDAATSIVAELQAQNDAYADSIGQGYGKKSKKQKKQVTTDLFEKYGGGDYEAGKAKYLDWAREVFGQEVSVNEFGDILDGKGKKIGSNVDAMQRFAKAQTTAEATEIAEKYQSMLDDIGQTSEQAGEAVKKFGNKASMTQADLDALGGGSAEEQLKQLEESREYETLPNGKKIKRLFKRQFTEEELMLKAYLEDLQKAQEMREENVDAFRKNLSKNYGLSDNILDEMMKNANNMSSEMLTGFTNAIAKNGIKDSQAVQDMWDELTEVINTEGLTPAQREDIARQFYSLDMTDKYALEAFQAQMEETYKGMDIDWEGLIKTTTKAANALHKISQEELPTFANDMTNIISSLRSGAKNANFTQEEYDKMSKALDNTLKDQFVRMNDGTYQFIGGVTALADALADSTETLIREQINVIKATRQSAIDTLRTSILDTETKDKGIDDEILRDIKKIYTEADLNSTLGQINFRIEMQQKGYSDLVDVEKLIEKGKLSDTEEEEYFKQEKNTYQTEGQTLSPTKLNAAIMDAQSKITRYSTSFNDKETRMAYEGYTNAKIALAERAGIDNTLTKAVTEAQEKTLAAQEKYNSISPLVRWMTSAGKDLEKARKQEEEALKAVDNALFQATSSFSDVNIASGNLKRSQDALVISQNAYKNALKDSTKGVEDLVDNIAKQKDQLGSIIKNSQTVISAETTSIEAQKTALINQYGKKYGKDFFVYDEESKSYKINEADGRAIWDAGEEDAITKALEELNKKQETLNNAKETQEEARRNLKELEDNQRNAMASALDKITPILEQERKEQIDNLSNINESINEVQSSILEGMRESIELERQIRDNTKKEDEIQDKETRLAYLMADSSGANANEIASLQKEISEARQDQTDTLIDQALDNIEKENEKASEQRQQQIDLMTQQLELDKQRELRAQALELLQGGSLNDLQTFKNSDFASKIKQTEEYKGLTEIEKEAYLEDLFNQLKEGVAGTIGLGVTHYATGGLVESTGPAWLDGTPSNPELVLNSQDARNFLMLKDVLSELVGAHTSNYNETDNKNSNTSYVDIDINVDSLSSDYDVDNIANRIQEYLAENALYRNTTMVSNRR